MTKREALWDWDLDSLPENPADDESRSGHEPIADPITEPIPLVDVDDEPTREADGPPWEETAEPEREFSYARPFIDRQPGSPISALTFKPAPRPWYRTKPAMTALIAALAVAILLAIIPLVSRSPGTGSEESTDPAPTRATSAEPSASTASPMPSGVQPTLTSAPAPPPPPPPPPPESPPEPPPAQDSAPVYTREYPAPRTAAPNKPEIGVTRPPISVAPEVRTPPTNSANVGDGAEDRGFW